MTVRGARLTPRGSVLPSRRPMIISTRASVVRLLIWQWRNITFSLVLSLLVVGSYELLGWKWLEIPTLPAVVVGAALGIFVSFRTNSAYDRWWEGRKLWGRLINTSRHFTIQALRYVPERHRADTRRLVLRHVSYVNVLRCLLRSEDPLRDEDVGRHLSQDDRTSLAGSSNLTARLLDHQMRDLVHLNERKAFDDFRLRSFDESLRELLDIQGGCERIKKTPLPRIYSFMSERMVQWFGALFPCALVAELNWGAVPIAILVTLGFKLISETGRVLEDPFSTYWNGLPLSNMSRMIEINLLELLGDTELPDPVLPNPPHVLM